MTRLMLSVIVSACVLLAESVNAASLELTYFDVPWDGRPRDPFVAPDGKVWFCGQQGNYLASLDPGTGTFRKYDIPPGSHPHNLIVSQAGHVWFAGNRDAYIGKLFPETGDIERYDMPDGVDDPHTLVFDKNENIWFTAQHSNVIGFLNTESGKVDVYPIPTQHSRPYGIKLQKNGQPWAVLLGSNKLAYVSQSDGNLTEIELPRKDARPRRLEIDENDLLWYADYAEGYIGRYDINKRNFKEWPLPGGRDSMPYATVLDHQGVLWISETNRIPNQLIGFDTDTETFTQRFQVNEGGHIRHTYMHPTQAVFWFGLDTGFIGKANTVH